MRRNNPILYCAAFTVSELVTAVTIISVLSGLLALLFPNRGCGESAGKARAATDVQAIVSAIKSYATEYGKLPVIAPQDPSTNDAFAGDPATGLSGRSNALIFNTLHALDEVPNKNHSQNPRRLVFFEGKIVSQQTHPQAGFLDDVAGGGDAANRYSFFDPWGCQYNIILDTNHDNLLNVGEYYQDFKEAARPKGTVGVFSLGKDHKLGTNSNHFYRKYMTKSDDVVSWVP